MTDTPAKLKQLVGWLNTHGGFDNQIQYRRVEDAAWGLDWKTIATALKKLEENKDEVKDPTAFVCAGLKKEGPAGIDSVVRKQVGYFNTTGGMQNTLKYKEIAEAAAGLDKEAVTKVFAHFEEKMGEINEPTSWISSALRKEGGGSQSPQDIDMLLRKEIGWLNGTGGFENQVLYKKVASAAAGLTRAKIKKAFSNLKDSKAKVKDPTAFVCSALRKEGGGQTGIGLQVTGLIFPIPADSGMEVGTFVRQGVAWLNNEGGFNGAVMYDNVAEAAAGLDTWTIQRAMQNLATKAMQVTNPTAFLAGALRKEGGGGGGYSFGGGKAAGKQSWTSVKKWNLKGGM